MLGKILFNSAATKPCLAVWTESLFSLVSKQVTKKFSTKATAAHLAIDVRKGVLGGLTPPLRLKIWAGPPSWKIFEQVTP